MRAHMRKLLCGDLASAASSMALKPCGGAMGWQHVGLDGEAPHQHAAQKLQRVEVQTLRPCTAAHLSVPHSAAASLEQHHRALGDEGERRHLDLRCRGSTHFEPVEPGRPGNLASQTSMMQRVRRR